MADRQTTATDRQRTTGHDISLPRALVNCRKATGELTKKLKQTTKAQNTSHVDPGFLERVNEYASKRDDT